MDLTLNQSERDLIERIGACVPARSAADTFDAEHWRALREFIDDLHARNTTLHSALAVAEAARLGSLTPLGVHILAGPLFAGKFDRASVIAVVNSAEPNAPVRYGAQAELLVRYEDDQALLYATDPTHATETPTRYVYPFAAPAAPKSAPLASAPAEAVRARHRLAIAAEAVGAMDSALRALCAYLTSRRQFGRPLGALQAIQHRLAERAVDLEMGRWLVHQAAWDETAASAAIAAAHTARSARRFVFDVHQLAGARGFTLALGLSFDTLRLQALSIEAGGPKAHEAEAFALTWPRA